MKIQILADLHAEFENGVGAYQLMQRPPWEQMVTTLADVVVLAGDTHIKGRGPALARALWLEQPIVMVAGNHEYYGETYPPHLAALQEKSARHEGLHFLENRAVQIDDMVFLGCTLWTDGRLFNAGEQAGLYRYPDVLRDLEGGMNDYRHISFFDGHGYRRLRPADTIQEHRASVRWLQEQFAEHRGKKLVVVTHHAPSQRSVHESYKQDSLSAAYTSHLDELVEESGALVWIHGHTHFPVDYQIGATRVIANTKGYPFEKNSFRPELVVEI